MIGNGPRWLARRHVAGELALVALVAVASVLALRQPSRAQRFTVDESRWISTSRYFWITFVEGDLFGEAWQPNYLVLTHPPVARYVIGFGLWLQGWRPDQLNGRYDSSQGLQYNLRAGNVPSERLLAAARRVVFVPAVASVVLLYLITRRLAGPVAGIAAAALAISNPLLSTLWTRALAESILACFSLLGLLLAVWFLALPPDRRIWPAGPLSAGVAIGLASATKLSGGLGAVGLAIFAAIQQCWIWRASGRLVGVSRWIDFALGATVTFIVVNPLLYPSPVERGVLLVQHRLDEMREQMASVPRLAVPADPVARSLSMYRGVFEESSLFYLGAQLPLDPALVLLGIGVAGTAVWRDARSRVPPGPLALLLCWWLATYAISTANLGYRSSHYFAPPLTVNMILEGIAIGALVSWTHGWLRSVSRAGAERPAAKT